MASVLDYANPTRFLNLVRIILPWLSAVTLILLAVGIYGAFTAPADYQQGETVRIMYIHVPSAWIAVFAYVVMTSASLGVLVWKHPLADAAQKQLLPLVPLSPLFASLPVRFGVNRCGDLLGVGRAPNIYVGIVFTLSWSDRHTSDLR